MTDKKVVDIGTEYTTASKTVTEQDLSKLRKSHAPKTGKLEHDVDGILLTKGVQLNDVVKPKPRNLGR